MWLATAAACASLAFGGTVGQVVAIGGHAADVALDEARGVLYVANFTANRVDVVTLADGTSQTALNVAPQPVSLALSPDGKYLVVAHYGNFQDASGASNVLTVVELASRNRQTFALPNPGVGTAFGIDNRALVLTTKEFLLFNPVDGSTELLDTITGAAAKALPQPPANFPPNIVAASVAASGDGFHIYGITDTHRFHYDLTNGTLQVYPYVAQPPQAPRVVSVPYDGSFFVAGWALFNANGRLVSQFPDPAGIVNVGSHVVDSIRGFIYGQIPKSASQEAGQSSAAQLGEPVLQIMDLESLGVREELRLPENLAGKSVLSSDGSMMYAVSDSGVIFIPIGALNRSNRVASSKEDLVFRGNFCEKRASSLEVTIFDPGGGNTDFKLSTKLNGVTITPASGVTPATVRVSVDPTVYADQKGTVTGTIVIESKAGANLPAPIRVLINNREPDQRGAFVNVPGKLVDILADPVRDRFFVVRQDRNEILVFDGANQQQVATLRTSNTPTQMAITFDRKYLLVGHDNSQIIRVFDLETLTPLEPVIMPSGHYPRSIAASGRAILAASRVFGPKHMISRVELETRRAVALPSLGVYENDININTALVAAPNGSAIMAAQADGSVMLYDATADTFTISRKDFGELSGAYAASSLNQFVAGGALLNASLVPVKRFDAQEGQTSGFAFIDRNGLRAAAATTSAPGLAQRVDLSNGDTIRAVRTIEAPAMAEREGLTRFTRTIAPLASRSAIVLLTTSGFTVLPFEYDAAAATPRIERISNAADGSAALAPGSLFTLTGTDLSPVNLSTPQRPLPTVLADSCLTINNTPVPLLLVSPSQINGQLPFQLAGNANLVLRTPTGVSEPFSVGVQATAPAVFRNGVAGEFRNLPQVTRGVNDLLVTPSNPVHRNDLITVYLAGMGETTPGVPAGATAPRDPAAEVTVKPEVTLGGVKLSVNFAGMVPDQVGLYRINLGVPRGVPLGLDVPLAIRQGGFSTQVAVRVVD
jgi:uncharacterized protein (TIGR03437 family)